MTVIGSEFRGELDPVAGMNANPVRRVISRGNIGKHPDCLREKSRWRKLAGINGVAERAIISQMGMLLMHVQDTTVRAAEPNR